MKLRFKAKWILPFMVIGVLALPAYQVVACGTASQQSESVIKWKSLTFKTEGDLTNWAKSKLQSVPLKSTA